MGRRPDFIIIGAMKCMTSTLHYQLSRQSGVFMSEPKEPCFFSDDEIFAKGHAWYENLFTGASAADLCGESSTHYTKLPTYPETVNRLADYCPNVKLVYIMRHPIDRLISHYIHAWTEGQVSCSIDQAVDYLPEMIAYGQYDRQILPYLERFGSSQVLPVFFDRLRYSPSDELLRIALFLGLESPTDWTESSNRQNVSHERLRRSRFRDAIVNSPGLSWARKTIIPRAIRNHIKGYWQIRQRPQLSVGRLQQLTERFDESLSTLGGWLGIQICCDNFRVVTRDQIPQWQAEMISDGGQKEQIGGV